MNQTSMISDLRIESQSADKRAALWISGRLLIAALVAYCLIGAVLVVTLAPRMIRNSWENTAMEAPDVYAAIRTARTGSLYSPYTESPYIVQSYGPLYYAINAAVARLSRMDVRQMVLRSRTICYVCYLLCGVFVFAISRNTGSSFALSLLASLMAVGHPDFLQWSVTVRPDILFLLAMLVSLYFAVRADPPGWSLFAISGLFAGLAFLLKQPGMAAAIAIFGVWISKKKYRPAAIFAISAAVPVLVMFAILIGHEKSFLEQFTAAGKFCWSLPDGAKFLAQSFIYDFDGLIRVVPLCVGVLGFVEARKREERQQLIAWFALVNWAILLTGLPQRGAFFNYFLPGWASCALLLPAAVECVRQQATRIFYVRRILYALIVAMVLVRTAYVESHSWRFEFSWSQAPNNMSYAALQPYRIISDVPILSLYGHDPDLVDTFAVRSLELNGHWSSAPIVENLRNERYDLILMLRLQVDFARFVMHYRGISDYAPSVVTAINQNYVVLCSTPNAMVLRPRDRNVALGPQYFSEMLNVPCGTDLSNKPPALSVSLDAR